MDSGSNCQINLGRNGIKHVLFVDLDTVPNFFIACDELQNTRMNIIPMTEGIFVWCFCRKGKTSLSHVLGRLTYFILLSDHRVEIDCTPLSMSDAPSVAMTMTIGNLHELVSLNVPFTILGRDSVYQEVSRRLDSLRIIHGISADDMGSSCWKSTLRETFRKPH